MPNREYCMANKDVLVVDDDVLVCESLKEMLILEGFSADAVLDGQAAMAKIQDDHYQMVLSDIQMPGLNGIELLKELKGRSPDTAVIFITGHGHIAGAVRPSNWEPTTILPNPSTICVSNSPSGTPWSR